MNIQTVIKRKVSYNEISYASFAKAMDKAYVDL